MRNNKIIVFEGLDCSFKETNHATFVNKLKEQNHDLNIHTCSFPRYGHWSAMGVEKWLDGTLDRDVLKKNPITTNSLYTLDRLSYWYELENNIRRIDLLNDAETPNIFVFDRYNFSNVIYNPIYSKEICSDTLLMDISYEKDFHAIPNADIIVWMRMRRFDVLQYLLSKKKNKDLNEKEIDFIKSAWERSEQIINDPHIFDISGIKLIVVENLNEDGTIKSRDEIADFVYESVIHNL